MEVAEVLPISPRSQHLRGHIHQWWYWRFLLLILPSHFHHPTPPAAQLNRPLSSMYHRLRGTNRPWLTKLYYFDLFPNINLILRPLGNVLFTLVIEAWGIWPREHVVIFRVLLHFAVLLFNYISVFPELKRVNLIDQSVSSSQSFRKIWLVSVLFWPLLALFWKICSFFAIIPSMNIDILLLLVTLVAHQGLRLRIPLQSLCRRDLLSKTMINLSQLIDVMDG